MSYFEIGGFPGITNETISEDLEKTRIPFSVSTIANIAALTALEDVAHVKECAAKNAHGRELLLNGISALGYNVVPSQSNFIFIHFKPKIDSDKMYERLLENKIIVRRMEAFGDNTGAYHFQRHEGCLQP